MSISFVNEFHTRSLIEEGEEWNDLIEALKDHFEVDGDDTLELEFFKVFEDVESFYGSVLREIYGIEFFSEEFADGVVEVNDQNLREAYEMNTDLMVVDDLYGHRIYVVREV